jgi:hypothetical protein
MLMIRALLAIGPFLFGLAFIAPVVAQCLQRAQIGPLIIHHAGLAFSLPIPTLAIGLTVGGTTGLVATIAGRWL